MDMSFSPGRIQAGICSLSIVIWVTRVFADAAYAFRSVLCFNEFCKFWKKNQVFDVLR